MPAVGASGVALIVTVVVPAGKVEPDAISLVSDSMEQLSVAAGVIQVATNPQVSIFAGQLEITGASSSVTVTT